MLPSFSAERSSTRQEDIVLSVRDAWTRFKGSPLGDFPVYSFPLPKGKKPPTSGHVGFKIPKPESVDPTKPFLVAVHQLDKKPFEITLLGICPSYKQQTSLKDLTFDMQDAIKKHAEMSTTAAPPAEMPVLSLTIPEFFVFKGRPQLPALVEGKKLYDEMHKFWVWISHYGAKDAQVAPFPFEDGKFSPEVLFFVFLMVAYDDTRYLEHWIKLYRGYIRSHLKRFVPDVRTRVQFAKSFGLEVKGPDEVEEKIVSIVTIEAARLRDEEGLWLPNVPTRLSRYFKHFEIWFPFAKKK